MLNLLKLNLLKLTMYCGYTKKKNITILRKNAMQYLKVKCHDVCYSALNVSEGNTQVYRVCAMG